MSKNTLVLLSGGMDSAVAFANAINENGKASAVSFNYGQKHSKELESAKLLTSYYRSLDKSSVVNHFILDLTGAADAFKGSSLTGGGSVPDGHYADESMKKTVVPNRNMIMLSLAAGVAIANGLDAVVYGAHAGDHAIYPDCRPEFYAAVSESVKLGNYDPPELLAPFIEMTKSDIAELGLQLQVPFHLTWSCYKGGSIHCGTCGTCTERKEAFELLGVKDLVEYRRK